MARFVVHVSDEQAGEFVRAYAVNVTHERVYVSPFADKWAEAAGRLEAALNSGSMASSRGAVSTAQQARVT